MTETTQPVPVRRRRRRRRRNYKPLILLLALVLIGLVIWGICLLAGSKKDDPPEPTVPAVTTAPTQTTTQPPEPTIPEPTEPPRELTPEEKIAAFAAEHGLTMEDYPEKLVLMLTRNPETEEYVLNYPLEYGKEHEIDISGYKDYEGVPLFIQWDKQWGYIDYVGNQAGLSGCGPTCLSMIAYHYTRDPSMTPAYMMEYAEKNHYGVAGSGTQWSLFGQGAEKLGLTERECTSEEIESEAKLAKILNSGKLIVANVGPGVFTEIGHYIVLVGYEDGKFQINDPNSYANSAKMWEFEEFSDQIKMMWAISG